MPQDNLVSMLVLFLRSFLPGQGSSMFHWPKAHPQATLTDHRALGTICLHLLRIRIACVHMSQYLITVGGGVKGLFFSPVLFCFLNMDSRD